MGKDKKPFRKGQPSAGFTLLETLIVVILLGLFFTSFFEISDLKRKREADSYRRGIPETLSMALMNYALVHGHYPLPAGPTLPLSDPNVFMPVTTTSDIPTNCGVSGPAGATGVKCRPFRSSDLTSNKRVYMGSVPVSVLGLRPEEGLDQYGNKYIYVVNVILTNSSTFSDAQGTIRIVNQNNTGGISNVHFVVVSTGLNRAGGYDANGNLVTPSCSGFEEFNCFGTNKDSNAGFFRGRFGVSGATISTTLQNSPYQGDDPTTYFDDTLAYKTSILKQAWIPRDDGVYFTSSGQVGIGFRDNEAGPTKPLELKRGNIKTDTLITPTLCDRTGTMCFNAREVANSSNAAPLRCGTSRALKAVNRVNNSAKKECDALGMIPGDITHTGTFCVDSTTGEPKAAKGLDGSGKLICNP